MLRIAGNIYGEANAEHGNWFVKDSDQDFLTVLAQTNPRHAMRLLELAMGFAVKEGRRALSSIGYQVRVKTHRRRS